MIDWSRVNELRDEVGPEDFLEVVELFLEEVDEVIERLETSPDAAKFEEDFHALKGSALNLGFQAFAEHCATEEKRAAAGAQSEIVVATAVEIYQSSKQAFNAGLETLQAA